MRNRVTKWFVFAFCGALIASFSTTRASTVNFVSFGTGNAHGGGTFVFKVNNPPGDLVRIVQDVNNEFVSFCAEDNEVIVPPVSTYTAVINGNSAQSLAILGGGYGAGEPVAGGDPLDTKTATLFHQYAINPNLIGGWNPLDVPGSTNDLQMAIWYIEHELNNDTAHVIPGPGAGPGDANLKFGALSAGAQAMLLWAAANDPGNIQDVRVLNLYFPNGTLAQDQLIRVTHDSFVPAPAALWAGIVLMVGFVAVRGIRRLRAE